MADTAAEGAVVPVPVPVPNIDSYDPKNDIMINITLYKKLYEPTKGETYKIYIKDITVSNSDTGEAGKSIPIDDNKRLVFDSGKTPDENNAFINEITDLINEYGRVNATGGEETAKTPEHGWFGSRSVSFRPSKKRRTAKKRRGRK